jgi:hypothetical protein
MGGRVDPGRAGRPGPDGGRSAAPRASDGHLLCALLHEN